MVNAFFCPLSAAILQICTEKTSIPVVIPLRGGPKESKNATPRDRDGWEGATVDAFAKGSSGRAGARIQAPTLATRPRNGFHLPFSP